MISRNIPTALLNVIAIFIVILNAQAKENASAIFLIQESSVINVSKDIILTERNV
jgi:hypothetical protein